MTDRISDLPDSLICHILSFLPTEQAIATSLLSKRWRPMRLEVPTLNFQDRGYTRNKNTYSRFIRLVYAVMLSRDGEERPIQKFRLKCRSSTKCDPSSVNIWVRVATSRSKVQRLSLSLPFCITLSFSLFSSTILVALKLHGFKVVHNNHSSISFPSLKVLHLRRLRFEERQYLSEIVYACPVLEVLVIKSLIFPDPFRVEDSKYFKLPKLVKADVSNSNICLPLKPFYDVQFLRIDLMVGEELPTHNLVNLNNMELSFLDYKWDWLIKFLCYCPNLQSLVIDKRENFGLFRSSDDENWVHPQCVPECLLSQLKVFSVKNYEGEEQELQLIKYIMQNARILRHVTICCTSSSNPVDKLQMLQKLTLCRRGSDLCQLHFE